MDKMRLMEAANEIADLTAERLGLDHGCVCVKEYKKDNGKTEIGFFVDPESNPSISAHPVIRAGEIVEKVAAGDVDSREAADNIAAKLIEARDNAPDISGSDISRDVVLGTCLSKVVSEEKNRDRLKNMPHRRMCDLAETVYFPAPGYDDGYIQVNYELMKHVGVEEEELFEAAHRNLDTASTIRGMGDVVNGILEIPDDPSQPKMFIVTNEKSIYGAGAIASKKLLLEYRDKIGEFFILPSSVHEVILLQKKGDMEVERLRELVRSVNESMVSLEDYLSDNVYVIDGDGEMSIA